MAEMTNTYCLISDSQGLIECGLSLADAARARLSARLGKWSIWAGTTKILGEITPVYQLEGRSAGQREWVPLYTGSAGNGGKLCYVVGGSQAEADAKIFEMVRTADWNDGLTILTDAEYDADQAALAKAEGRWTWPRRSRLTSHGEVT